MDRIAVVMAEMTLQPVRLMRDLDPLTAVTVRTLSGGRRFNVTITKTWPAGVKQPPAYGWSVVEVNEAGEDMHDGHRSESLPGETQADPEYAYWEAAGTIAG